MRIYVLFGLHETEQEVPMACEVADEYTRDENPEYLDEQARSAKQKYALAGDPIWVEIDLGVEAEAKIMYRLSGQVSIAGKVKP